MFAGTLFPFVLYSLSILDPSSAQSLSLLCFLCVSEDTLYGVTPKLNSCGNDGKHAERLGPIIFMR